jgi:hypothetical protein
MNKTMAESLSEKRPGTVQIDFRAEQPENPSRSIRLSLLCGSKLRQLRPMDSTDNGMQNDLSNDQRQNEMASISLRRELGSIVTSSR